MKYLVTDFETKSLAPIKKVGAWEYLNHESTEIMCFAWRIGTLETLKENKTKSWAAHNPSNSYKEYLEYLLDPSITIVAHKAFFERIAIKVLLSKLFKNEELKNIPISRFDCTMARACAVALPRGLDQLSEVLKLPNIKDKEGKRLIQKYCCPRKPTKNRPEIWNTDKEGLDRLELYCKRDVNAEVDAHLLLPLLIPNERKIWELDQLINERGFYVDRPATKKIISHIKKETKKLNDRAREITGGINATQVAATLEWLNDKGVKIDNLQSRTLKDILASGKFSGETAEIIKIRQDISRTSTKKFPVFLRTTSTDSRLHDHTVYCGASTGRDAGALIQPHNFARGEIKSFTMEDAVELVTEDYSPEWCKMMLGRPMAAFSSVGRGMITSTPGYRFLCADYNAIEARGVFWMSGDEAGLELFSSGIDPYKIRAGEIFKTRVSKIDDVQRFVGKQATLGLGYQMAWKKFIKTCDTMAQVYVESDIAKRAVKIYRDTHRRVVAMWGNMEKAACAAVRNPSKKYTINKTVWFCEGIFLYCQLPSGRKISFPFPEVREGKTPWGSSKLMLYHGQLDFKKKWRIDKTYGGKMTENAVSGHCRDIMKHATLEVEKLKYRNCISIHDEILGERKIGYGSLSEFESVMGRVPSWSEGMPIKVKGWEGFRYKKG